MLAGAMAHRRLLGCNGLSTSSSGVGELWIFTRFVVFWRLFIHYAWLLHLVGYCYAEASVFSSYSSSRDCASPTLPVIFSAASSQSSLNFVVGPDTNFAVGPDTREGCHYISVSPTYLD